MPSHQLHYAKINLQITTAFDKTARSLPGTKPLPSIEVLPSNAASYRCQAKLLTSAKFLTYYCLPLILLLKPKEQSLAITFLMCVA